MIPNGQTPSRRGFLLAASSALVGIGCLGATPARAVAVMREMPDAPAEMPAAAPPAEERALKMVSQRTGEIFDEVYHDGTDYLADALERFSHFARDLREQRAGEMDPELLDLAADLQALVGDEHPLILTHGFRTAASNRRIRNAAKNSFHLEGRALDIAHPGINARALHDHALTLERGGLGRYRTFVHIDTGPTRRWNG
jgi:uncharacterized protein YcbK (DUF882 family)